MYEITHQRMSEEFFACWKAAGVHLANQVQGGLHTWLRAHPFPPFLEHLSFRLGNQLFFVYIEDVDGEVVGPGSLEGLHRIATANQGYALLLPMKKRFPGGAWISHLGGWGLTDAISRKPIDPVLLVTDELIEMTDWEIHDMAVQMVRNHLEKKGYELMSWQSDPEIEPAIWFVGESKGPEWIVVRAARYPATDAPRPENLEDIKNNCARKSRFGYFASVAFNSDKQPLKEDDEPIIPLWRGHGMRVIFDGIDPI